MDGLGWVFSNASEFDGLLTAVDVALVCSCCEIVCPEFYKWLSTIVPIFMATHAVVQLGNAILTCVQACLFVPITLGLGTISRARCAATPYCAGCNADPYNTPVHKNTAVSFHLLYEKM